MATDRAEIERWFKLGIVKNASWMIVAVDGFDNDDYPIYIVGTPADFWKKFDEVNGKNMQRVMEVYDLTMDMAAQLAEHRAHHEPKRP